MEKSFGTCSLDVCFHSYFSRSYFIMPILRIPFSFTLVRSDSCSSAEIHTENLIKQRPSSQATKKCVTFFPKVFIQETIHITDYTLDEKATTWYTRQELAEVRDDILSTVRLISTGKYTGDTETLCARGCKSRCKSGNQTRQLNKLNAMTAVLEEQLHQQSTRKICQLRLSQVYKLANAHCRKEAILLGLSDNHAAKDVHDVITWTASATMPLHCISKEKRSVFKFFIMCR